MDGSAGGRRNPKELCYCFGLSQITFFFSFYVLFLEFWGAILGFELRARQVALPLAPCSQPKTSVLPTQNSVRAEQWLGRGFSSKTCQSIVQTPATWGHVIMGMYKKPTTTVIHGNQRLKVLI
jgi:hypothetical protein